MDKVLRAYKTLLQMMKDREYVMEERLSDEKALDILKKEQEILFKSEDDTIRINYFDTLTKEKIDKFTALSVNSKEKKIHYLFFCKKVESRINSYLSILDIQNKDRLTIEVFVLDSLVFPIVNHVHVPKHRKLSEKEKAEVFEYYGIKRKIEEEELEEEVIQPTKTKVSSRRRPVQKKFEEEEEKKEEKKPKKEEKKEQVIDYDKDAILKKFPILLLSDPVSRYYNFRPFDMIVIDEDNVPYIRVVFNNLKINQS